jgi:hypothetical protein
VKVSHDDVNYSMALTVCRLCLNQATGRPASRRKLGIAIRGALLAELALASRIEGEHAPVANGSSDTSAVLADSVHATIAARKRPVAWRRWYSHVDADVAAATRVLLESGVWLADERSSGRFHDAHPDEIKKLTAKAFEASSLDHGTDHRDLIIGLLAAGAGLAGARPRPRAMLKKAQRRLPATLPPDTVRRLTAYAAVRSALVAMKRR